MSELGERIRTAPYGETYLFSAGQAGFVLRSRGGSLLGIDLCLSENTQSVEKNPGFRRLLPAAFDPDELAFDVLVATHTHADHFDTIALPVLMKASPRATFFYSAECQPKAEALALDPGRCCPAAPGDAAMCGEFILRFVSCDHGDAAPDAFGLVVEVDSWRFYFAGDTCLRLDRVEELDALGHIDVMAAPINGAFGNMSADDCAEYAAALKPTLTIPCHYGMFAAHGGDPDRFCAAMQEKGLSYLLLPQGESFSL